MDLRAVDEGVVRSPFCRSSEGQDLIYVVGTVLVACHVVIGTLTRRDGSQAHVQLVNSRRREAVEGKAEGIAAIDVHDEVVRWVAGREGPMGR